MISKRPRGRPRGTVHAVCKRGHPLRGPGAEVYVSAKGYPVCKVCHRQVTRAWQRAHPGYLGKIRRQAFIALAKRVVLECWYRAGVYGGVHGTLDALDDALDHIAETGEYPPWLEEDR